MPTQQAHDNTWLDTALLLVTAAVIWGVLYWDTTRTPVRDWAQAPASYAEWRKWTEPVERNAFLRNPAFPHGSSLLFGSSRSFLMPDSRHGWAVGYRGTIVATADGGATWQPQDSKTKELLLAVSFAADGLRGYRGTIVATADGGATWQPQDSKTKELLLAVSFAADGQRGWAVGWNGTIVATADGGATWQPQDSKTEEQLLAVSFAADGRHGWAVGDGGTIVATADGGATWQPQASKTKEWLGAVSFAADGRHGWAVGDNGTIVATSDGGATWQPQASKTEELLGAVSFAADGRHGWAVGDNGTIVATADGGATWQKQVSGTHTWLGAVSFTADGRRGWAVGWNGTIVATEDGGTHWSRVQYRRLPSLAALLGSSVLLLLTGTVIVERRRREKQRGQTVLDRAVTDAAIDDPADDRFGFARIAAATAAFVGNRATRPPLVLVFTAPWGCGKSSMMNLLRRELVRRGLRPVWFNAWHHQKEDVLLAPLLDAISRQGFPPLTGTWCLPSLAGFLYRWRLFLCRAQRRPKLALCAALLFVGGAARLLVSGLAGDPAATSTAATADSAVSGWIDALIGRLAEAIEGIGGVLQSELLADLLGLKWAEFWKHAAALLDDPDKLLGLLAALALFAGALMLTRLFVRSLPESPADLLAFARGSAGKSSAEAQAAFRNRFREHFHDAASAALPRPLTIFIDDLDRLPPDKAMEMLEAINFLASSGPCLIVLGIARDVVLAQVTRQTGELALAQHHLHHPPATGADAETVKRDYARDYLRKLIQIAIPIPQTPAQALMQKPDDTAVSTWQQLKQAWHEWRSLLGHALPRLVWLALIAGLAALAVAAGDRWQQTQRLRLDQRQQQSAKLIDQWQDLQRQSLTARQRLETLAMPVERIAKDASEKPSTPPAANPCTTPTLDDCREQLAVLRIELDRLTDTARQHGDDLARLAAPGHGLRRNAAEDYQRWLIGLAKRLAAWNADFGKLKVREAKPDTQPAPTPAAPPAEQSRRDADKEQSSGISEYEAAIDRSPGWWNYAAGLTAVLAIALAFVRIRRRSDDTREFAAALDRWAPYLQADPRRSTPREITRFLNRARYAATRLGKPDPGRNLSTASDGLPAIADYLLVELTAAFHRLPEGQSLRKLYESLRAEIEAHTEPSTEFGQHRKKESTLPTPEEVDRFLRVVGDWEDDAGLVETPTAPAEANPGAATDLRSGLPETGFGNAGA